MVCGFRKELFAMDGPAGEFVLMAPVDQETTRFAMPGARWVTHGARAADDGREHRAGDPGTPGGHAARPGTWKRVADRLLPVPTGEVPGAAKRPHIPLYPFAKVREGIGQNEARQPGKQRSSRCVKDV